MWIPGWTVPLVAGCRSGNMPYGRCATGFRVVVAPRFGDTFRGNALKEGFVPVELPIDAVELLWGLVESDPTAAMTVDATAREVRIGSLAWSFPLDEFTRVRPAEDSTTST